MPSLRLRLNAATPGRASGKSGGVGRGWVLAALLPVVALGCQYSLRAPFDRRVKAVFVQFKSRTFRRDLDGKLIGAVQTELKRRTPYKVVGTPGEADALLEGTINYESKNVIVEGPSNLPRQPSTTVTVGVKWMHNPPTEAEKALAPTIVAETVSFVPEAGETATTAYDSVNQRLATQIVDMMEKPWFNEADAKGSNGR